MKKVLHITNWYPNNWNDLEAIFIKEQYKLFSEVTTANLLHTQVRTGKKLLEYKYFKYSNSEEGYYLLTKIKSNKIIELLTTFLLCWVLFKVNYKKYDLIHFHIAYPLLTYYHLWKKIVKIPIIMSEHWSAYHFNFYMPKETKKLNNIKRIFKQNIPLITVSKALLDDIENFSGNKIDKSYIIPNVIDKKYYYYLDKKTKHKTVTFFALNNWRKIKNPFPMLEGFVKLASSNVEFNLVIGGYGELMEDMKKFVVKYKLEDSVSFCSKMNKQEIANQLHISDAFVFSSIYETFSVVCAESLCCGVPIIGSDISSISEYANSSSYLKLKNNNADEWKNSLKYFIDNKEKYNNKLIEQKMNLYLSSGTIKKNYKKIIYENC